jgi:streptogramin lyase
MDEPHVPLSGILQQRLDPLTGQSEWVVVASGNRPLFLSVSLSLSSCFVQNFDLSLAFELLSAFSENFHEFHLA